MNWSDMSPRERDALVATEVMGWERSDDPAEIGAAFVRGGPLWTISDHGDLLVARKGHPGPWHPSTDISAAWEVVEKMEGDLDMTLHRSYGLPWGARFASAENEWGSKTTYAASAPEAICLAALRAKGVEV